MKINFEMLKNRIKWLPISAIILLPLTGCLNDDSDNVEPMPVAYVSIFNAAPDAPDLDVVVDNRQIIEQLGYTDYTIYQRFYTGERNFELSPFNADNVLVDTTINLQPDKAYSIFVTNDLADLSALVVQDSADTPESGKALIRIVNLSPDAPSVNLMEDNGTSLFANQMFKQASEFKEVDAATYNLKLNVAGNNEMISIPDADFRSRGIYTLIVRGFANPPAGNANSLSVQIVNNN